MYTMFVQNDMKEKPERKTRSESRDINENKIVQWLGESFGSACIRRQAAEWRRLRFYDVIRNMASSNNRWRQRRLESSQENMINGKMSSELILLWFASVYGAASSIQHCVLPLVLRLRKVQER